MSRVVLAGSSSPMIKFIDRLERIPNLAFPVLFTEHPVSRELTQRSRHFGMELRDIQELGTADGIKTLSAYNPDWLFNVNSTLIFPGVVLEVPSAGCLNMHPGQLPEYAGLHTHQWAIRNGEVSFGATLHWMVPSIDAGPLAYQQGIPVSSMETGLSLFIKCVNAGVELAVTALREIAAGAKPPRIAQDLSRRRIYRHREALDGRIDWTLPAGQIRDFVRAADYRPFKSPTYDPVTSINGQGLVVREVKEELPNSSGPPGTVLAVDDDGVLLAAGGMTGIRLITVELGGDQNDSKLRKIRTAEIGQALESSVGDVAQFSNTT